MNKELFNKIKSYLEKQKPVKVEFGPHHKGCDVIIYKKDYLSDYDFFETILSKGIISKKSINEDVLIYST